MQKIQKLLLLPIIAIIFCVLPMTQAAAAPKLELSATAGFQNKVKNGQGLPLTVTITNSGDAFSGDLVIDYTESYATGSALVLPIEIGAGETKKLELSLSGFTDQYMYANTNFQMFHLYEGGWEKGKSIDYKGNKNIKVNMFDPMSTFIVTLTDSADRMKAFNTVNVQSGPYNAGKQLIHLGQIKDFTFPSEFEAWSAADYMIIDEYILSDLSEQQQEAILGWIQNGGTAVIGASENTMAEMGILGGYLPLQLSTERKTVPANFFVEHSNGSRFEEDISVLDAELAKGATSVLTGPDSVLAAVKPIGSGAILQTAFSLGDKPLSVQPGYTNFLTELLKKVNNPASAMNPNYMRGQSVKESLTWQVGNVNELFPSFKVSTPIMVGIIVVYILLVGPLMYFLLKRKDKREHAWWIIPVVSIITSVAIFGYGAKDRIVKPQIQQTSLLEVNEDGSLSGYYMQSLLSNRGGEFSFVSPKDTTMTASLRSNFGGMSDGAFQKSVLEPGANQSTLTLRNVGYWSVNSLVGQTFLADAGKLAVDLKVENETVTGTITNGFSFSLKEVSIWAGSKFIDLGDLAPNASLTVNKKLGSAVMPPAGTSYSMNSYNNNPIKADQLTKARKESIISMTSEIVGASTQPAIVAYTEDSIIPVELKDERVEMSAVNVIMQPFKPKTVMSGEFTLPATSLDPQLTPVNAGGYFEPVNGSRSEWYLEEGDYTLTWAVPENMPMAGVKWSELQVVNTTTNSVTVQIKNIKTGEYEEVPQGTRHTIDKNIQDYITAEGKVELQIHKEMSNGDPHTKVPEVRLKGAVK